MRLPALALSFLCLTVTIACGGSAPPPAATPAPAAAPGTPVDPASAGTITGTVNLAGPAPAAEMIRVQNDPACIQVLGPAVKSDAVLVDAKGGVANAFVYLKHDFAGYAFDTPKTPVVLDQRGCRYAPRIFGVRVGQAIDIINSDPTLHNVHALPMVNQEFNKSQPTQNSHMTQIFTAPEVMVRVKCDIHPWMTGYAGVMAHPFFAVTTADGAFTIPGIPAGTYTLAVWHEKLGEREQTVTIAAGQSAAATVTLGGK